LHDVIRYNVMDGGDHMGDVFISERLVKLRTAKGVSARDMSLDIGKAHNYINNIENRNNVPTIQGLHSYTCLI
jgi:ribosome-binding protein aMBF1 (putative translation factor)